jgi:ABC-type antimicrobial peptide transport system permease subunit
LTFGFAIFIAIVLIGLLNPLYDRITGEHLILSLSNISLLEILFCTLLGTIFISSIYPAILLSSFNPLGAVREKSFLGIKASSFRKSLVVLQFVISFILLVSTIVMGRQMAYIRNKDLGYDKNYVFTVSFPEEAAKNSDAIENELLSQKDILNVSFSSANDITNVTEVSGDIVWDGKENNIPFMLWRVQADKNFIPTMKYQLIAGTNFTGAPSDDNKYILNETAVKAMGLKPPYIGTKIGYGNADGEILGVIKDFNFKSLKDPITPLVIRTSGMRNTLYVRTTGAGAQAAIKATELQYKKYVNNAPFSYDFLDKIFESHYQSQQRAGTLFTTFAAIAIFISCLGLFGLAAYTAQVKTKEIGIRKVLGASVGSVIQLISKDFLKLVIVATVIATPLAYWAINKWLQYFAYRTSVSWWLFAACGFAMLIIAIVTLSTQTVKAALANPVESLRTE